MIVTDVFGQHATGVVHLGTVGSLTRGKHMIIEGGSMTDQQQELFNDFESLEQAMLNNMISLDTYLNEYNRMVQEEGRRTAEASPWERAT